MNGTVAALVEEFDRRDQALQGDLKRLGNMDEKIGGQRRYCSHGEGPQFSVAAAFTTCVPDKPDVRDRVAVNGQFATTKEKSAGALWGRRESLRTR